MSFSKIYMFVSGMNLVLSAAFGVLGAPAVQIVS